MQGASMCLTSHGTIMHSHYDRPLLCHEWLNVHGFPSTPELEAPYKLPVDFERLIRRGAVSHNQVKSMVGLGWHALSMGPYVFFTLASLEMWSDYEQIPNKVQVVDLETDDEDDDISEMPPLEFDEPDSKCFKCSLKASEKLFDFSDQPLDFI